MSSLASPILPRMLLKVVFRNDGKAELLTVSRPSLKSEDEVPITKPALSNPRTHFSPFGSTPAEKFEPRYSNGAKPKVVGSNVPNSQGLNSNTVVLLEMTVSPGARLSATRTGMGIAPSWKLGSKAIEDQV